MRAEERVCESTTLLRYWMWRCSASHVQPCHLVAEWAEHHLGRVDQVTRAATGILGLAQTGPLGARVVGQALQRTIRRDVLPSRRRITLVALATTCIASAKASPRTHHILRNFTEHLLPVWRRAETRSDAPPPPPLVGQQGLELRRGWSASHTATGGVSFHTQAVPDSACVHLRLGLTPQGKTGHGCLQARKFAHSLAFHLCLMEARRTRCSPA